LSTSILIVQMYIVIFVFCFVFSETYKKHPRKSLHPHYPGIMYLMQNYSNESIQTKFAGENTTGY